MYWLRIAPLADDLREGKVPEGDKLGYVLGTAIIPLIVGRPSIIPRLGTMPGKISAVVLVLVTVLGTIACFRTNRRGDGRNFIERFVSLGFPATLRWLLITYVLIYGFYLAAPLMKIYPQRQVELANTFQQPLTALLLALVYVWIAAGMRRASSGPAADRGRR